MRAVVDYGTKILNEQWLHTAVTRLGVDETAFLAATATSHTQFATGLVDLRPAGGGPARLLDVVEGRSGKVLADWLDERGPQWCNDIEVAALDPFRGYHNAFTAKLPTATVVLDAFHAVKLANTAVDTVRRRVQHETLGHRGRKNDPLYTIRRGLLRGAENQTKTSYGRLLAGLDAGDPTGQVAAAYIAAQELRHVYAAPNLDVAKQRLLRFYWACATPGVPELERLARTIETWQDQLLAYFTTGRASNGPTEAVNLLIKRIKRVGFGFRNFDNYRLRLLLHCGVTWHTPPQHDSEGAHHAWRRRAILAARVRSTAAVLGASYVRLRTEPTVLRVHEVYRDDEFLAFLGGYPRLPVLRGYVILSPLAHKEEVVDDFSLDEYLRLQAVAYRLGRALRQVLPTERLYSSPSGASKATRTSTGSSRHCLQASRAASSSSMR